jgi:hypothetical protein
MAKLGVEKQAFDDPHNPQNPNKIQVRTNEG